MCSVCLCWMLTDRLNVWSAWNLHDFGISACVLCTEQSTQALIPKAIGWKSGDELSFAHVSVGTVRRQVQ